jgi:hypothetical protein
MTPEQLNELHKKLAFMRHEVNNQLSMVIAAIELLRLKPEMRDRMLATLDQQPPKIMAEIAKFSAEFERAFNLPRK